MNRFDKKGNKRNYNYIYINNANGSELKDKLKECISLYLKTFNK